MNQFLFIAAIILLLLLGHQRGLDNVSNLYAINSSMGRLYEGPVSMWKRVCLYIWGAFEHIWHLRLRLDCSVTFGWCL